ncbi:MAG: hypothetical protein ACR2O5_03620 [Thiogranum sp.]
MHTIYIHIDENLDEAHMRSLSNDLKGVNHIVDVEINARTPHDMLVEFEEHHISPMAILRELSRHGVHADIMSA